MSFLYATILLYKSFRSLAHSRTNFKLHCTKVGKSEVCGSPVFSNPTTITTLESSPEVTTGQHVRTHFSYLSKYLYIVQTPNGMYIHNVH